ncbi:unnamed protein product [Fraxinus pennsylvanica]|uniref:Transmembrane protein n=1 Tax=Fraxinus pennsylvanica TaxID=56036 RepID=A0AAD2E3T9_9LAMI|nr:unnamed protein product [Fraxinus pennsylvanica]
MDPKHSPPSINKNSTILRICTSLFSTIFTLYILILLYFPAFCHGLFSLPVLFFISIILLYLLRLGASQEAQKEAGSYSTRKLLPQNEEFSDNDLYRVWNESESTPSPNSNPGPNFLADFFVEWNVRAPLEVIHESVHSACLRPTGRRHLSMPPSKWTEAWTNTSVHSCLLLGRRHSISPCLRPSGGMEKWLRILFIFALRLARLVSLYWGIEEGDEGLRDSFLREEIKDLPGVHAG